MKHKGREGGKKERGERKATINKMTILSPPLSVITVNVHRLNSPIKRHRWAEWIKKQDPTICYLQVTYLRSKDTHRLKVKERMER